MSRINFSQEKKFTRKKVLIQEKESLQRKEFEKRYRIRQAICVILGICTALVLTLVLAERRAITIEAKAVQTQKALAQEVFRFHVLANSDSEEDQTVKLKVRDAVISYMKENMAAELGEEADVESTRSWAQSHLEDLKAVADQILEEEECGYRSEASVEYCYFPDKRYGDFVFPHGYYEALRIRLGEAEGHNWWCVLYPNLCFTSATCAVVSDEGKEDLKEALTAEEYEMVTATTDFKIRWFFFGGGPEEE